MTGLLLAVRAGAEMAEMYRLRFIAASTQKKDGPGPSLLCCNNNHVRSDHVNLSALEFDGAVGGCEEREVLADADIRSGEEPRPALADDYRAGLDGLAAVQLEASKLRVAVSAVS